MVRSAIVLLQLCIIVILMIVSLVWTSKTQRVQQLAKSLFTYTAS